jgi:hypothetical protein
VATFHMAPDYTKFHAFSAQTGISVEEEDNDPVCRYNIVSDDEDENGETTHVSHPKTRTIDLMKRTDRPPRLLPTSFDTTKSLATSLPRRFR